MYWHLCVVLVTRVCDYLEENSGASSQRIGTHFTSIQRKIQVLPRSYDGIQVTKGITKVTAALRVAAPVMDRVCAAVAAERV